MEVAIKILKSLGFDVGKVNDKGIVTCTLKDKLIANVEQGLIWITDTKGEDVYVSPTYDGDEEMELKQLKNVVDASL